MVKERMPYTNGHRHGTPARLGFLLLGSSERARWWLGLGSFGADVATLPGSQSWKWTASAPGFDHVLQQVGLLGSFRNFGR